MTTIEIITICFSSIALLVSFLTVYYNFFRKKLSFVGCLAAYNSPFDEDTMICNYEFSLSNNGNRELLVREVMVDYVDAPNHFLSPMIKSNEIPAVIKPNQILLVKVPFPRHFMKVAAKEGFKVLIQFCVFSSDGENYMVPKLLEPLTQEPDINPDGWKPFKMEKSNKVKQTKS